MALEKPKPQLRAATHWLSYEQIIKVLFVVFPWTYSRHYYFLWSWFRKQELPIWGTLFLHRNHSLYTAIPQRFFKALHKECLHTKCLLLTWTTQTSIISSVRKAEEICILFLLCKLCKHQHNPPRTTPTATAYLEAASKARIHLFKSAHSLHTEPKCRNTEKQRGTS